MNTSFGNQCRVFLDAKLSIRLNAVLISFILLFSCAKEEVIEYEVGIDISYITSRDLPGNPAELKILGIGNSFTEDAMALLPYLLDSAHIYNVKLGILSRGGASLEDHLTNYRRKAPVYVFKVTRENLWYIISDQYTINDAINFSDWDIIILQQVSKLSGQVQSYQPYLNRLIKTIDDNCSNTNTVFGWHMTWAYASNYVNRDFGNYNYDQWEMYTRIVNAVKVMQSETGIKIIIPSGTAIQNLRNTPLNDPPMDLTGDGLHIMSGVGRYTLSCTWFQELISPALGIGVAGNKYRVQSGMSVTDNSYIICQQAAIQACNNKFEVTTGY